MLASQLETLIDEQALQSQDPEDRYLTTGVSWRQYEALLVQLGDRPGFRVTYLDGVLEIVSPSLRHEDTKSRIGDLLPTLSRCEWRKNCIPSPERRINPRNLSQEGCRWNPSALHVWTIEEWWLL